jgi:Outer membrane protein beta-barrel domain
MHFDIVFRLEFWHSRNHFRRRSAFPPPWFNKIKISFMKKSFLKISSLFTALFFAANSAQATGFFVGADINHSNAIHQLRDDRSGPLATNGNIKEGEGNGYGLNAGFRLDLPIVLAFAEAFYDQIGTSATAFETTAGQPDKRDRIEINNRYGAKVNVGLTVFPRTRLFVGYGLASVSYSNRLYSISGGSTGKSEMSPIYSAGFLVDLIAGLSLRASYDYQSLNLRYANDGVHNRTQLGVAKLGVMYRF